MTDVMDDARRIKRGILDFIHTYGCEQAPEEAFGALARDVFIYQYTYDLPYRRYCAAKRVHPRNAQGLAGDSADAGGRVQAP